MNKYEKLIEYIVNEQEEKARELFHDIVVEKSRDIYESLMSQDTVQEVGGDQVEDLVDEITSDEEGISEDDLESTDMDMDTDADAEADAEMDMDMDAEELSSEEGEEDLEAKVMDLEDALDELKAEFDALMNDMGSEESADEVEVGSDEESKPFGESKEETNEEDESEEEEVKEGQAELDQLREYVEKIAAPSNKEGADNTKSTVAGKNDMGGTTANIAKGGEEKGRPAPKAKEIASGNINVPGGKAGNTFGKAKAAKTAEEGSVNDKSVESGSK